MGVQPAIELLDTFRRLGQRDDAWADDARPHAAGEVADVLDRLRAAG